MLSLFDKCIACRFNLNFFLTVPLQSIFLSSSVSFPNNAVIFYNLIQHIIVNSHLRMIMKIVRTFCGLGMRITVFKLTSSETEKINVLHLKESSYLSQKLYLMTSFVYQCYKK